MIQTHDDQIKFVRELLGTPYVLNSKDRSEGLDCWSLTQTLQRELFGRELPDLVIENDSVAGYLKAAVKGELSCGWQSIEEPVHGCIVELTKGQYPHHCGTYIDIKEYRMKGLVHSLKGCGVIFDSWITLKAAGWRRFTYNVPRNS